MFPAAVQAGRRGRWAVFGAVAATWCAVYVAAAWPRLGGPVLAPALIAYGALFTPLPVAQWPRLFTTWLVHLDPVHLGGNLVAWGAAWLPWPEPRWHRASRRFAALCACGLGASLVSVFSYGQRPSISAGPSGALVGLLVLALIQPGRAPRSRAIWLLTSAALLLGGALTGGDNAAHLGGAATGLFLSLMVRAHPR